MLYKDKLDISLIRIIAANYSRLLGLELDHRISVWCFEFEFGKKKLKITAFVKAFNIFAKLSLGSNKTSFIHKTVRRTIGTILINGGWPDRRRQCRLLPICVMFP